ncbi:DUF6232 family protein [Paracoccus sp. S3-43]|uniref:DUF6232 family protein n=1 Tax=Paracoccus sp. S3-43 TaxID=3030011 RepID=UPI0023B00E00|nr:DUF6232 family protein [Paracoccus sp. S3-43]WEF23418.1 DUF6232 family protein [Paracoccus sp. S3-43]
MVSLPYKQHGVSIDKTLGRGNGETIQIATITSIHLSTSYAMWWMPGLAAGVAAFGSLAGGGGGILFVALAAAAVLCFWLAGRFRKYNVVVTTASGEHKVFAETRDAAPAQEIRSALEMAISERG